MSFRVSKMVLPDGNEPLGHGPLTFSWNVWRTGDPGSRRDFGQEPLRHSASRSAFRFSPMWKLREVSVGKHALVSQPHGNRTTLPLARGSSFSNQATIHCTNS